jgi:hypothetical protein
MEEISPIDSRRSTYTMTSVSADFINSNPARATSKIQKILMRVGATSCQPEAPKYSA